MTLQLPADLQLLLDQLSAIDGDADALVAGLSEVAGTTRPAPGAWSVAECLDHLATANRVYLEAMDRAAQHARVEGRLRRRPAKPGLLGGLFVHSLEPPPRRWSRLRAPRPIEPRQSPPLTESSDRFVASHREVREFVERNGDLDLAGIRFPNPLVAGVRFSLATGLHVILAHERRHLFQAWRVRRSIERVPG
ncbi:MAG: DinB family protein [Gemmatimonadetes bacterium]|nr:DinB family protein [Gemmatimonadota bacterium]